MVDFISGPVHGKVWGTTQLVYKRDNTEVHRIEVVPNGYCSLHLHRHKYNAFFVESGSLVIDIRLDTGLEDTTTITSGMMTTVAPGMKHRFTAPRGCVAYEIYYTVLPDEDIVRDDVGGVHKADSR